MNFDLSKFETLTVTLKPFDGGLREVGRQDVHANARPAVNRCSTNSHSLKPAPTPSGVHLVSAGVNYQE
jgi:hypothetical protein